MRLAEVAIIGGTGVGGVLAKMPGRAVHIPTLAGQLSAKLLENGILTVSRHSVGHALPPHKVNYRAIALGLRASGAKFCFSTAAVGSLRKDWPNGTLVAISDFSDLTGRNPTLFDDTVVHTDFSQPFSCRCRKALVQAGKEQGSRVEDGGVYVCENGPRYETPHEIKMLQHVGDVIGMTAATEAVLLHEAGVEYGCLAEVTNMAAGLEDMPLSHTEVVENMLEGAQRTVDILFRAAELVRN